MIVRDLNEIAGTERELKGEWFTSFRLLLAGDGMGFSLHVTRTKAGAKNVMHYKNHLEAFYCISGHGQITDLEQSLQFAFSKGTVCALNNNERFMLEALTDLELLCVFNPPCVGPERHNEDGSYDLIDEKAGLPYESND